LLESNRSPKWTPPQAAVGLVLGSLKFPDIRPDEMDRGTRQNLGGPCCVSESSKYSKHPLADRSNSGRNRRFSCPSLSSKG